MSKIFELLKKGETEKVEFKLSLSQRDKIIESISAFSNTTGGAVVIGVTDKGKIVGVDIGKSTIEKLANQVTQNTDPMVYLSIRIGEVDENKICKRTRQDYKQRALQT